MYENASTLPSGSAADLVLGQPDFGSLDPGNSASQMNIPAHALVDGNDNLWVADRGNNRVLKFVGASTLVNGAAASIVLGQVDFFQSDVLSVTASTMENTSSLAIDAFDNLWIAEGANLPNGCRGPHAVGTVAGSATRVPGASGPASADEGVGVPSRFRYGIGRTLSGCRVAEGANLPNGRRGPRAVGSVAGSATGLPGASGPASADEDVGVPIRFRHGLQRL